MRTRRGVYKVRKEKMEGRTIIISEINKSNYFIYSYVMLFVLLKRY